MSLNSKDNQIQMYKKEIDELKIILTQLKEQLEKQSSKISEQNVFYKNRRYRTKSSILKKSFYNHRMKKTFFTKNYKKWPP